LILAAGGAGFLSSCAAARGFSQGLAQDLGTARRSPLQLTPVNVAEDRVIRVDVGLRPYRPTGFRVEREAFGEKTLVHNYGHGGGGITLSWGTSKLAVDLGFDSAKPDCAVIGCGAVGMATARLLQERGAHVKIYAKDLPPNTTSNVAGAQWWPASVFNEARVDAAFHDRFYEAALFANRRYQTLVGGGYGVTWERNFYLSNRPAEDYPAAEDSPMRQLSVNQHDLRHGEHPFEAGYVRVFDTMMIETPLYLRRVESDFRQAGGTIEVRAFNDRSEIAALPERTIFNCSGLGAGALFGDTIIEPVRGQLVILLPQEEVDYNVISARGYMFGRHDGIVLGGTFEHGNWSLQPDDATTARLLAAHKAMFAAMAR
jgi:glycine/D-amino acid oxidase-like deaminating enzyme